MPITIGANITSLLTQRKLGETTDSLTRVYERLSSGQRINRASDDAAGLSIASQLRADSRVFAQALRNVNDGISLISIAEGALSQLSDIVIRQRELAEQAANGTYGYKQRASLDREADALVAEYNRIIQSTSFNGQLLMDGTSDAVRLQHGKGIDQSTLVQVGGELGAAAGSGNFLNGQQFTVSSGQVNGLTQGDFDGDGITDFVVQNGTDDMQLFLGNADGSFESGQVVFDNSTTVMFSYAVRAGDFNGDGALDLVFSNGGSNSVTLGNGNGSFRSAIDSGLNSGNVMEIADFNGDGKLDIVDSIGYINIGRGDGTFTVSATIGGHMSNERLAIGDYNGDGHQDIAITNNGGGAFEIYLGYGNGTFRNALTFSTSANPYDIRTEDFNNDGILDLVTSSYSASRIDVHLGNGDGTFGSRSSYLAAGTASIITGDFNGDGNSDITGARYGSLEIVTLFGRGDGTFSAGGTSPAGAWSFHILSGDYNSDGVTDLAYGNFSNNSLQVKFGEQDQTGRRNNLMYRYDLTTRSGALEALDRTSRYLDRINRELAMLGSSESRLGAVARNLTTARENFMAAESRIMDADIAAESAQLVRMQILQQAASSVLASANQAPELALKLLRS